MENLKKNFLSGLISIYDSFSFFCTIDRRLYISISDTRGVQGGTLPRENVKQNERETKQKKARKCRGEKRLSSSFLPLFHSSISPMYQLFHSSIHPPSFLSSFTLPFYSSGINKHYLPYNFWNIFIYF